jgi:nucleoside-diphosphate-sugar epimerase
MRALVTGGGGFIGSNLVEALLKRGDDVLVLDDFSTGRRDNLHAAAAWAAGGGAFELLEGDVRDPDTVRRAVQGREVVLHHAAIPSVAQSVADPLTSHEVNVDGTLVLLLAARDAGVRRFVFASSSAVYGDSPALPKVETMPTDPISPYGLHKVTGETYCRLFHQLYGLPTVALRYFNVFGPRQDPTSEYSGVISRFIAAALRGQPATIFGDGEQTRDFIFVEDVVQANLRATLAPEAAAGQVYNIARGERTSLLQLIELIGELTGRRIAPRRDPPRSGDIRQSRADVQKAASVLDFTPRVGLREGLSLTVDWRRAQG